MTNKELYRQSWKTVEYEDNPELPDIKQVERVADFLPPPEELIFREKGVNVTITLSEDSPNFLKAQAERLNTPCERMIRNLIDDYVQGERDRQP